MRAAILHHHLAIDVASSIRDQEIRKIDKLSMLAGATKRGSPAKPTPRGLSLLLWTRLKSGMKALAGERMSNPVASESQVSP